MVVTAVQTHQLPAGPTVIGEHAQQCIPFTVVLSPSMAVMSKQQEENMLPALVVEMMVVVVKSLSMEALLKHMVKKMAQVSVLVRKKMSI